MIPGAAGQAAPRLPEPGNISETKTETEGELVEQEGFGIN